MRGGYGTGCKVAGGYDFADYDNDPRDRFGHGTSCAGIAAALTNNNIGIAGICGGWNQGGNDIGAKLYALKISGDNGRPASIDAIALALYWACDVFHCRIVSNSWSVPYSETIRENLLWDYLYGASLVFSKGNRGSNNPVYPADLDKHWITAVGSIGRSGEYCDYPECGYKESYGNGIDVVAPGHRIPTTGLNGGYDESFGGTSAAAPHAAGVIGLLRSVTQGLQNEDTDWILKFSAYDLFDDSNEWTWNEHYGHGALRASTVMHRFSTLYDSGYDLYSFTAVGGYIYQQIANDALWTFIPGGQEGGVDVFEVRIPVIYPIEFEGIPYVWGVGKDSWGRSAANPNYRFDDGFSELVPGSQYAGGCTLRTYIYNIPSWGGWFVSPPENLIIPYRVWGIRKTGNPDKLIGERISDVQPIDHDLQVAAYPNPFNSSVQFVWDSPSADIISISIYDILGKRVRILLVDPGASMGNSLIWDRKDERYLPASSGIYLYKVATEHSSFIGKITYVK